MATAIGSAAVDYFRSSPSMNWGVSYGSKVDDRPRCMRCHDLIPKKKAVSIDDEFFCPKCAKEASKKCAICNKVFGTTSKAKYRENPEDDISEVCYPCLRNMSHSLNQCDECGVISKYSIGSCEFCRDRVCGVGDCEHLCEAMVYRRKGKFVELGGVSGEIINNGRTVGLELEFVDEKRKKGTTRKDVLRKRIGAVEELHPDIDVVRDGSVEKDGLKGLEVVLPPASGVALEQLVAGTCKTLKHHGFGVNKTCGVHVHIDARDFKDNPKALTRLFKTYYSVEDILFSLNPPSRRKSRHCASVSHSYCFDDFDEGMSILQFESYWYGNKNNRLWLRGMTDQDELRDYMNSLKGEKYQDTRYCALNLHALYRHGTIEFRHHAGSLNAEKILRWSRLLQEIIEYSASNYDEEKVVELAEMDTGVKKLKAVCKLLGFKKDQVDYLEERVKKFNDGFKSFQRNMMKQSLETKKEMKKIGTRKPW
jgi:hypothetical protein